MTEKTRIKREKRKKRENEYSKQWYLKNKSKAIKRNTKWALDNKDKALEYQKKYWKTDKGHSIHLKRKFGITVQDYLELFNKQKGCCAICKKHQFKFKRKLAVDHDHKTGKIRKLLCEHCNRGLGAFYDKSRLLQKAIVYLQENQ